MTRTIALLIALLILLLAGVLQAAPDPAPPSPPSDMTAITERDSHAMAREAWMLDSMRLEHETEIARLRQTQPEPVDPEAIVGVSIPIILSIVIFLFLWRSMEARKTVRLAMIEKGMDPSLLEKGNESTKKYGALRIGMLLTGTGLGLLIGMGLTAALGLEEEKTVFTILSCALLFGGIGLIAYHRTVARLENQRGEDR